MYNRDRAILALQASRTGKMRWRPSFERLEQRNLLAADWTNARNHLDVNDSGLVTALDVLLVINDINAHGMRTLPPKDAGATPTWLDVNSDDKVTARDALQIINAINYYTESPSLSFVNSSSTQPGSTFTARTTPNAKIVIDQLAAVLPVHLELTANAEGEVSGLDVGALGMLVKATVTDPLGRRLTQDLELVPGAQSSTVAALDESAAPTIGQPAPEVELLNQDGVQISLHEKLDAGTVVLYFYPKDNTPKCTVEAQDLRKRSSEIEALGATILGVSVDPVESHLEFANKYDLNFDILSDVTHQVSEAYGVLTQLNGKGIALRTTFIIGSDGIIKEVFRDVNVDMHTERVIAALRNI